MKAEAKLVTLFDLERMKGLAAQATPGAWRTCGMDGDWVHTADETPIAWVTHSNDGQHKHDAAFIASSRTFVPAAISTIRRLVDALTPLVLNEIDCDIAAGVMHRPCIDKAHALLRELRGED